MDDVLKVFRVIAPEFSNLTDEEVTAMLELFAPMVSKNTFGAKYNLALAYFVAHILALNGVYASVQGSSTDGSVAGIKRRKNNWYDESNSTSYWYAWRRIWIYHCTK